MDAYDEYLRSEGFDTDSSGGSFDWSNLGKLGGGLLSGFAGQQKPKKKKLNLTPFLLIGGALVVLVVVAMIFKRK